MFFKSAVFKRLLTEAWKGPGLTVGHDLGSETREEGYYLSGGYWVIWIAAGEIPNKEKGAIIELCGELPESGQVFKAMKDYGNQYEVEQSETYHLPDHFKKCGYDFRVTKMIYQQDARLVRFLQGHTTNKVTAISQVFINLIDPKAVDYDNGETEPRGPRTKHEATPYVMWGNETCFLLASIRTTIDEEEVELWKHLEKTELI